MHLPLGGLYEFAKQTMVLLYGISVSPLRCFGRADSFNINRRKAIQIMA